MMVLGRRIAVRSRALHRGDDLRQMRPDEFASIVLGIVRACRSPGKPRSPRCVTLIARSFPSTQMSTSVSLPLARIELFSIAYPRYARTMPDQP